MSQLTITLFGVPLVEIDGQQIEIPRRKAMALLSYLAVTAQPHSRESLATLLWPQSDQRRASASLRSALWALNKTPLDGWLSSDQEAVVLPPAPTMTIDVLQFQELVATPEAHDHPPSDLHARHLEALERGVSLYHADFMAGFTLPDTPQFDEWQFFQADRYRSSLANALEQLLGGHRRHGNLEKAIDYGRRFAALDPLHEPAQVALLRLYRQAGQRAAAKRQFELYRETLAAELAIEPSAEIVTLYEQIARSSRNKIRHTPLDQSSSSEISHNIPPDPTPFIGRADELDRIVKFLENPQQRLITIVGPGGMGKTRLAFAAARVAQSRRRFHDGVYVVSLAPVSTVEGMLSLIAETVGYPLQNDQRTTTRQLIDYFQKKSILLLLDNFEHLLSGATFVAELLPQATQVTILATSRERLNLYEEQQVVLGGLALLESGTGLTSDYPAAVLFRQCALRRRPKFRVETSDLPHLAEICRLVEGMPLGLELAAVWTEMLSLSEIATEIRHNLDFLETAMRNVPNRHRSMRAVFDTSWQRLTETEQRTYAQLSVFRGGFTAAAAKTITGGSIKTLASLVNQSLLRANPRSGRYDSHELLRQYAADKLRESSRAEIDVRDQHAAFYCGFLQERETDLKGRRQQAVLADIEADLKNIESAWQWAAERAQINALAQALVPLALYYWWYGRVHEGANMCRLALATTRSSNGTNHAHLQLKLLTWQGLFDLSAAKYEAVEDALQRAQIVFADPALHHVDKRADEAFLLLQRSSALHRKTFSEALALNEQSLAAYRAVDDSWGITQALDALGIKHQSLGNYALAVDLLRESLAICEHRGDPRGIAKGYGSLGHCILFAGDLDTAEQYLRRSLALFQALNLRADQRAPLLILGINLLVVGKFQESIDSFEACWAIHRELGIPHEPGSANVGIARSKIDLGAFEEARHLSETHLIRYQDLKLNWYIAFTLFNLGRIALADQKASEARDHLQASVNLFLKMDDGPLVPDVLFSLAIAHRQLGERQRAIQALIQALTLVLAGKHLKPLRFELPVMALLLLDVEEIERAVELYSTAQQSAYIANSVWFQTIVGQEVARAASTLPADVVAAAETRGQTRDLWSTAQELLAELKLQALESERSG